MPTIFPHNPVRKGLWEEYPPPIGGGTICIFFLHLYRKAFHGVIFGQVRDDNHLVLKVIILDPGTIRFLDDRSFPESRRSVSVPQD